jgi:putative ABC transport system ATP-binding protein
MVEIFADLEPGHPFFEQFAFIDAEDLPATKQLLSKVDTLGVDRLAEGDRRQLKRLPLDYVEARHRLELIGPEVEARVIEARRLLRQRVEAERPGAVEFYDPDRYNATASLQDNILFGRIAYNRARAEARVGTAIAEVLNELGLRERVIDVGLDYQVGVAGKRLSAVQRQKLALGRALMKRPDLLVVDQAIAIMDGQTQARLIHNVLTERADGGVLWVLHRARQAEHFDRVVVVEAGNVVEQDGYAALVGRDSALSSLLAQD